MTKPDIVATSTITTTNTPNDTITEADPDNNESSGEVTLPLGGHIGLIVGIVIGVIIGVIGAIIAVSIFLRRRKRNQEPETKVYYTKNGDDEKVYNEDGNYYTFLDEEYQTQFMESLKHERTLMGADIFTREQKK